MENNKKLHKDNDLAFFTAAVITGLLAARPSYNSNDVINEAIRIAEKVIRELNSKQ
jgi:hypothetical protein